ncbi:hypothetical protein AB4156_24125 [Cupriavidus sp. 2MCAB6]|uniref:hypothetical protein n=1 Tax=Cupriavidus sp. 2MCAB6 TaxID=3232981 RepID=UPI003F934779
MFSQSWLAGIKKTVFERIHAACPSELGGADRLSGGAAQTISLLRQTNGATTHIPFRIKLNENHYHHRIDVRKTSKFLLRLCAQVLCCTVSAAQAQETVIELAGCSARIPANTARIQPVALQGECWTSLGP